MKLKKTHYHFFLLPAAFGMHRHNPPKLLPTAVFGKPMVRHKKFHSRTDESRFCRLLRF